MLYSHNYTPSLCVPSFPLLLLLLLFLLLLQPDDAGLYTCMATNVVGVDSHTVALAVHTQPIFSRLPGDAALSKGERLMLACGAAGAPLPKITWAFNNNILPGSTDKPISPPIRVPLWCLE